jgi:hypothetical protein
MKKRSVSTDEEIGIESYHIKRQQAVERAMEKARLAVPGAWTELSPADLEITSWILGQVWSYGGRKQWDEIQFSGMTVAALVKLIQIGDGVMHEEVEGKVGFDDAAVILAGLK